MYTMPRKSNPLRSYGRYKKKHSWVRGAEKSAGKFALGILKHKVLPFLNTEQSFLDTQTSVATINSTHTILQLCNMVQGDDHEQRQGDQVKFTSISIKWTFKLASDSSAPAFIRVMLIRDKQTNGAIYTAGDIFTDASVDDTIVSALNLDNKYRFDVIMNKVIQLNPNGRETHYLKFYKKLDMLVRYGGNAGTIADLNSDSYSLLIVSDIDGGSMPPTGTLYARMRFVDN